MKSLDAPAVKREEEEDWGRVFQEKSNISPA
jgi:hypothetical protein